MKYSKLFYTQIPSEQIVDDIKKAITKIYALSVDEYNSNLFHDIAIGFKSIVYNMEKGASSAFPLFLKWLKLYVKLQHQIDPRNKQIEKFEKRIPVCTSYIVASLQYQTKISNYHLQVMEMCSSLFDSASPDVMKLIANLEMEIIALLWMPIEFVGDYNTQKMSLKLIAKVLKHLNEADMRKKVAEINRCKDLQNLLLRLTVDDVNFEKISRKLLNMFNMRITESCAVFSVYSTTTLFGSSELFKPASADKFWIDFNYTSKSVSFLCQLKQGNRDQDQQELSIQIQIDKLQIDNQFDCIVLSIEPAIFSVEVSPELRNARIAVFTLPQTEVERLKANRDLLDFYNKSYSESDLPPTPNTIEQYLAEDDCIEVLCSQDNPVPEVLPEVTPKNVMKNNQPKPGKSAKSSLIKTVDKKPAPTSTPSSKSTSSVKELPKNKSLTTSGYNTSESTNKPDVTIFKKPTKPVPRTTKTNSIKQTQKANQTKDQTPSQLLPLSGKSSRKFFKTSAIKVEGSPPKKPKRTYRKRQSTISNTGISPKRKQVNTVKPLNHLTKPDCDPEEAALEYVENGGYANIISFLNSTSSAACFNEQQRQQIIKNVEKINLDLERSTQRFFPKHTSSDTDDCSIWKPVVRQGREKAAPKVAQTANFVPYSRWKMQQKEKSNGQSTLVGNKLEQKKQKPPKTYGNSGASCSKPNTSQRETSKSAIVEDDNRSCSSSASSCSNHNFHIFDSDNELIEVSSDEDVPTVDTVRRRESDERELSPVPVPIELPQSNKTNRSCSPILQVSAPLDDSDVDNNSRNHVDQTWLVPSATANHRDSYEMSEIFEDPDVIQAGDVSQNTDHLNLVSSFLSELASTQSHQSLTSQVPFDVHTESEGNHNRSNTWYVNRYLNDQQVCDEPPSRSYDSLNIIDSTPGGLSPPQRSQNVQTNQVIIQNQIVLSTFRKRPIADVYEESSLAKIPRFEDHVSLQGSSQIFPSYVEKVTKEKDRLLNELEGKLETDVYENVNEIVEEVMKSMEEHETAINEAQEQLSFIFGKLEWLIENHQKHKSQLESIYCRLIGRIKASMPKKEEISRAYDEAAEKLKTFSTTTSGELWKNFANGIVSSIEDRLTGLVNL